MARRRKKVSHAREVYYILSILAALFIALLTLVGPGGYLEMKKAELELESHRARVEELKRSNEERLQTIESFKSDPETVEGYARRKGYARKGEIVQEVPETRAGSTP